MALIRLAAAGCFLLALVCWQAAVVEASRTYQVWIGMEDLSIGLNVNRFFPKKVKIHPGDKVIFKAKTHDPHTVTFYQGELPDMIERTNLNGQLLLPEPEIFSEPYNGTYFAGSGLLVLLDDGSADAIAWEVTFGDNLGEFPYACGFRGMAQTGSIIVVDPKEKIPTPAQVKQKISKAKADINKKKLAAYKRAQKSVRSAKKNGDGTKTHYVLAGYREKDFEFLRFFNNKLVVKQGDKITWSNAHFATISFLNGRSRPQLISIDWGTFQYFITHDIALPRGGNVLSRTGYINSGIITNTKEAYTLTVPDDFEPGKIKYSSIARYRDFHGTIVVEKRKKKKMN